VRGDCEALPEIPDVTPKNPGAGRFIFFWRARWAKRRADGPGGRNRRPTEKETVANEARIRIGTSGWSYRHWRGPFYPSNVPQREWLPYYAGWFRTVEINNSFYHRPREETLAAWKDAVPWDFLFAAKASRFVTHRKKLTDPADTVPPFLDRIEALGKKIGPILFQLPPRWGFDPGRLESFLAALRGGRRYAFELRDPSWINDRACGILARHGAAFCIYELDGRLSPKEVDG